MYCLNEILYRQQGKFHWSSELRKGKAINYTEKFFVFFHKC